MKHLIPLHDNLIVKPAGKQEMVGMLVVPQAHQKSFSRGTVMDLAPGCSGQIKKGDEVTYSQHTETPVDIDGEKYLIISESTCLAVVRILPDMDEKENPQLRLLSEHQQDITHPHNK